MNDVHRDISIFKHAIGAVLLIGIGIAILIEILSVIYLGLDYLPYLFVCIVGLILVSLFYAF
jgi:flagellar biosynthesis protein FliQ